VTRLNNLFR